MTLTPVSGSSLPDPHHRIRDELAAPRSCPAHLPPLPTTARCPLHTPAAAASVTFGRCISCTEVAGEACLSCDLSAKTCSACKAGYGLSADHKCVACSTFASGCKACDVAASKCTACERGKYVDAAGLCAACPSNCATCALDTGVVKCSACRAGFYVNASEWAAARRGMP